MKLNITLSLAELHKTHLKLKWSIAFVGVNDRTITKGRVLFFALTCNWSNIWSDYSLSQSQSELGSTQKRCCL